MHVLVVEDSVRLRETIATGLRQSGYAVDTASDGESGLRYAKHNIYDVIVLDLMMPIMDGLTMLEKLRSSGDKTHVLILTAKGDVRDRIVGLRQGADDYLPKPFSFDEMLARIEALVRRQYRSKDPVVRVRELEIDTASRTVSRQGEALELSRREYVLLELLAYRRGEVVSRREIEDHLYGENNFPMSNAVDRIVCTLRKKIESDGSRKLLRTRRGLGYVLGEREA